MNNSERKLLKNQGLRKHAFPIFVKASKVLGSLGIGKIPGVSSVFMFFYRLISPKGIALINSEEHPLFVDFRDRGVAISLIMGWSYEKLETEIFKSLIKPGMIVIDIGANIGYYALVAARLVGNSGKVYAFEPEPNSYRLLLKNIELNGYKNIVPIQKAVSNGNARTKLFIDKVNLGAHSLLQDSLGQKDFVEIETISLDWFIQTVTNNQRVDFIKIDIEGAEGLAIKGAKRTLSGNPDLKMLMEFTPDALQRMGTEPADVLNEIHQCGFKIAVIRNNELDENSGDNEIIIKSKKQHYLNLLLQKNDSYIHLIKQEGSL